jgi:hypothetical protein
MKREYPKGKNNESGTNRQKWNIKTLRSLFIKKVYMARINAVKDEKGDLVREF